jgi:hypothetical protein
LPERKITGAQITQNPTTESLPSKAIGVGIIAVLPTLSMKDFADFPELYGTREKPGKAFIYIYL